MKRAEKVNISCAITGSIHTPSMSPHLPVTPAEIADSAIEAAEAGAAILHLHARSPETGRPTQDPEVYKQFLPVIKQRCDAILNITTGGGLGMTLDERLATAKWAQPEIASMNMGSFNFNISGAGGRIVSFKNEWEKPYLEITKDFILSNTFTQIERGATELGALGTRFEFECYDVGHLYNLAHFADRKLIEPPFFVQCIFGILGGIGPDPDNLMRRTRGQPLSRQGPTRALQRRTGAQDPAHPRRTLPRDRHTRRGPRDATDQGRRQNGVLSREPPRCRPICRRIARLR